MVQTSNIIAYCFCGPPHELAFCVETGWQMRCCGEIWSNLLGKRAADM